MFSFHFFNIRKNPFFAFIIFFFHLIEGSPLFKESLWVNLAALRTSVQDVTLVISTNVVGDFNITVGPNSEVKFIYQSFTLENFYRLAPGTYQAIVNFDGNQNYTPITMEQEFVIPRSSDDIIIVTNNITVGSDLIVTVYAKFDGLFM